MYASVMEGTTRYKMGVSVLCIVYICMIIIASRESVLPVVEVCAETWCWTVASANDMATAVNDDFMVNAKYKIYYTESVLYHSLCYDIHTHLLLQLNNRCSVLFGTLVYLRGRC